MKIGPLALKSALAFSNVGVDTNVFNQADADHPQSDFTATLTPTTDVWLRMGPTRLSGTVKQDFVYYNRFSSERSLNNSYKLVWLLPLNRLTMKAGAGYLRTKDRPGFEIDARSRRNETDLDGAVEIRASGKTHISVKTLRHAVNFDAAATFLGTDLHNELNRTTTTRALSVRYQLTPLTSLAADVSRDQDRFEFSPLRDSDSTRIAGTVVLDSFALIKGSATFGYRDFTPLSADVPAYKGATAVVDLWYSVFETTKLSVQALRDVQYSFDINQPYYLQTGLTASFQRQLSGPFDAIARIGVQQLDYRDRLGALLPVPNRIDHVHTYGGGIGYRLGRDARIGFNVDRQSRTSGIDARQYDGLRVGTSVTYGL